MTACEILDSENFLGAENDYNLFCCRKDLSAEMEEDKARLQAKQKNFAIKISNSLFSFSKLARTISVKW